MLKSVNNLDSRFLSEEYGKSLLYGTYSLVPPEFNSISSADQKVLQLLPFSVCMPNIFGLNNKPSKLLSDASVSVLMCVDIRKTYIEKGACMR